MSSLREIRNARCFYSKINKSKILKHVLLVHSSLCCTWSVRLKRTINEIGKYCMQSGVVYLGGDNGCKL